MVRIRFDADGLRRRREASGLNQGELAALLGMREGTYRSYESAARQPKEPAVSAMACLFGIEPCELMRVEVDTEADAVWLEHQLALRRG